MAYQRFFFYLGFLPLLAFVGVDGCKPLPRKVSGANAKLGSASAEPTDRLERLALRLQQHSSSEPAEEPATKETSAPDACPPGAKLFGSAPPKGNLLFCGKASALGKVKMGPYTKWDDKGVKRYEAYFIDDVLEGGVTNFYSNGEKSDYIEYQKGIPNGLWEKWNRKGVKVIEGHFYKGKKDGYFRYWNQEGVPTSEGALRDEVRSGSWTFYDRGGALKSKIQFKAGEKDGKAETFYQNGNLASSGSYASNKPDGLWVYYSREGRVEKRGHYALGTKVGEWQELNAKGNVTSSKQLKQAQDPKASKHKGVIDTQNGFMQM